MWEDALAVMDITGTGATSILLLYSQARLRKGGERAAVTGTGAAQHARHGSPSGFAALIYCSSQDLGLSHAPCVCARRPGWGDAGVAISETVPSALSLLQCRSCALVAADRSQQAVGAADREEARPLALRHSAQTLPGFRLLA